MKLRKRKSWGKRRYLVKLHQKVRKKGSSGGYLGSGLGFTPDF